MKDIVDGFNRCRKVTDFYRLQIAAEDYLSPTEFAELHDRRAALPGQAQEWLDGFLGGLFAEIPSPRRYERLRLGDHVWFFGHGPDEPRRPHLLIAYCGILQRLMVPISVALQHIDAEQFDIVVLTDPSRRRYLFGIDGFAEDFEGILAHLGNLVTLSGYDTLRSIGASSGGLAALRTAIALEAERAVLLGGRPMSMYSQRWRFQREAEAEFEAVFARADDVPTRVVCAFAADNEADREGAETFARSFDVESVPVPGIANHNILFEIFKRRRLGRFLDDLLLNDAPLAAWNG